MASPAKMDDGHDSRCFFLLINAFTFLTLNSSLHSSLAADTISPGQSLSGNQTLVSKSGTFELGFFSPGNSHKYYIGIWFKNIPSKDIIWVANRQAPILNPSTSLLKLSKNGNLVLLNKTRSLVWSSDYSSPSTSNSIFAVLLDTGNLVITKALNSTELIWQSFDHLTHAWMPGGWLGLNKVTGESQSINSWRSSEDPSPGRYTAQIESGYDEQLLIAIFSDDSRWGWSFYPPNGHRRYVSGTKTNLFFTDFNKLIHLNTTTDLSVFTYILMEPSGLFRQMIWLNNSQQWISLYSQPEDQCMVYLFCGSFSLCDRKSSPVCSCLPGFKPASMKDWELGVWESGCTRKTSSKCDNSDPYGFFKMGMVELPPNSFKVDEVHSDEECEKTCQRDCFCTAYAFDEQCSICTGDLPSIKQLYDGDLIARTLNIRLAASDIPSPTSSSSHTPGLGLATVVISSVVAGVIVIICLAYAGLTWFRVSRSTLVEKHAEGFLISFTYADLQRMTKNFSDIMGRGGFGSVFKGALPDSTIIAVKKLEGLRQGEKQFRAEISTLGSIQHVNLVHLKGFCCEGNKRLLVYDYMSGGSLDSHLFRSKKVLDWETRFKIIIGVARALAYVHEKCRECIIHCDIKPENILLDREFSPKVADFGMAKLTSHDFSKVLTTMRGTLGYLAPEWISVLPITPKVDVYSFGMLLFEVVSGERNWQNSMYSENDGENCYFPIRAARQLLQGNVSDLLDKRLQGEADLEEVERVCRVACWCIQDSDAHRPTMGQVVQILEGVLEVDTPPVPWFLQNLINSPSSISCNLPQDGDKDVECQGSFALHPAINCS